MEHKKTYSGQYRRFGDFFRKWEITAPPEATREEVLSYCRETVFPKVLPEREEWLQNIRHGSGAHSGDASYYFRGWCTLFQNGDVWKYTVCEPWDG